MLYISSAAVAAGAERLRRSALFADFLAVRYPAPNADAFVYRIPNPTGEKGSFGQAMGTLGGVRSATPPCNPEELSWRLHDCYPVDPRRDRFFIPFAAGDRGKEGEWRQGFHGRSGVQRRIQETTRAREFRRIVASYHQLGRAEWELRLTPDYTAHVYDALLGGSPIWFCDFIAWVFRFVPVPEDNPAEALAWLRRVAADQFRIPERCIATDEAQARAAKAWFFEKPQPGAEYLTNAVMSEAELREICDRLTTAHGTAQPQAAPAGDSMSAKGAASLQDLLLRTAQEGGSLWVDAHLLDSIAAHLRRGHHILLMGPPGTGKSTLARNIMEAVTSGALTGGEIRRPADYTFTTASANWTTFDTIGGYVPTRDGELVFRPGLFLQALASDKWVVVDEVNRADADKAFGPFLTVLAGLDVAIDLPFETEDGLPVRILPPGADEAGEGESYSVPIGWRMIGTLNTFDKNTLFRLSYAFLRRFAVVYVPTPPADQTHRLAVTAAELTGAQSDRLLALLVGASAVNRPLGPASAIGIAKYVLERTGGGDAQLEEAPALPADAAPPSEAGTDINLKLFDAAEDRLGAAAPPLSGAARDLDSPAFLEALVGFVLPQMEGLETDLLMAFRQHLLDEGVIGAEDRPMLDQHFREFFELVP